MPQKLLDYAKNNYLVIKEKDMYDYPFGGGNGKKWLWISNEQIPYMVKEQSRNPPNRVKKRTNKDPVTSYNNSILSEYVGSQVINTIDFNNMGAQNTMLVYNDNKDKVYVACEIIGDIITIPKLVFKPISLINGVKFGSKYLDENHEQRYGGVEVEKIVDWIKNTQDVIEPSVLLEYFYNMFVVDAFLLNWDRNFTNWGFVIDNNTKEYFLAPLIDQGSSLFAKQDFKDFELINNLEDDNQIDSLIQNTKSFFKYNNSKERIKYMDFIATTNDKILLQKFDEFVNHMKNVDIQEIIDSLSIPQEYKQTYTKLLERSLFNINKFINLNPLYKEILKEFENKQKKEKSKNTLSR